MKADTLFFIYVVESEKDTMYMGYGGMDRLSKYVLVPLEPSDDMLSDLNSIGPIEGSALDVMPNFDPDKDMFKPITTRDKSNWEDLGGFQLVCRLLLADSCMPNFACDYSFDRLMEITHKSEEAIKSTEDDPRKVYDRVQLLHDMRQSLDELFNENQSEIRRRSVFDLLMAKIDGKDDA